MRFVQGDPPLCIWRSYQTQEHLSRTQKILNVSKRLANVWFYVKIIFSMRKEARIPKVTRFRGSALHQRPRDRVVKFLTSELEGEGCGGGEVRLPPMRDLATRLKVSTHTVQVVFRELVQQGRIRTAVGNGSFLVGSRADAQKELRVALSVRLDDEPDGTETWKQRICGGVLQGASASFRSIALLPLPANIDPSVRAEYLKRHCAEVDGLVAFPHSIDSEVRETYRKHGKAVVDLNPPTPTALVDFASPDYFTASLEIGRAWKATERRRVLLFIHEGLEISVSNQLRLAGLASGLGETLGGAIEFRILLAPGFEPDSYAALRQMLTQGRWIPDAVYCSGDYMAVGAIRALREYGLAVPREVSVIGGTGMETEAIACPGLTCTRQPMEQIGRELARLLCEKVRNGNISLPGRLIRMPLVGGATTRAVENKSFRIMTLSP